MSSAHPSLPCLSHPHPQCDKEIEQVQSQLEDYKDPPLSLSRLSLKQQKFKTFRERANVSPLHLSSNIFISTTFCWGGSFSSVQIFQLKILAKMTTIHVHVKEIK